MPEFAGSIGKIHYGRWEPEDPTSLVVFFHGLGEHIGSYEPFTKALNAAGIAVWASDHSGHGRSEGERVLVERIDDLIDDAAHLLELARAEHPVLPFALIGHSLGSAVVTLLVADRLLPAGIRPTGLVLTGSSLVPRLPEDGAGLEAALRPGVDPMTFRKDPGELTRNTEYARQIRDDPLTWQGGLRFPTLRALVDGHIRLTKVVESRVLTLPVLLIHGEEDDLAPAGGARRAAERLPDGRVVVFPLDRHNILNELDRDDVYRVLLEFLAHLPA
ncbi:alpha/beta fold hydrolase [Amycolatopsis sp.]|uniref:alpha/beta fold hydrolase n=1 Tax=Amycolatopsis sp. TaxID=37632 RepID=UPI002E0BC040|nr:alpha/beta fold hydrolase [Amycolatopsis sp.]